MQERAAIIDHWLSLLPRKNAAGWTACALVIATAVAVRVMFPIVGPFLSFYPAILFCAMIGGNLCGIAALLTGLAVAPFYFGMAYEAPSVLWSAASWASFAVFGVLIVMAVDFQQRVLGNSLKLTDHLQRQRHFTDSLVSAAPSLTYVYEIATGRNVFISPQIKSILGYEPHDIAAMGASLMTVLLHPDDAPRLAERFAGILEHPRETPPDIEYRMRRKDGSYVWLLSSDRVFQRAPGGKVLQILGVATDISARKRFEEQLLASEERFRGLFETAPTGISISDIAGNFIECNPAYERILGYSMDELRNVSFATIVHPDDRAANLELMHRLVRREVPHFELFNRSVHKSGRIVWVHKVVSLLRDRQGEPVSIVAMVTDMTERKHQEEQIRLLMREVNHRSKNLLAVVQSLARQTAAQDDPADFATRFGERLQGLAASHDLLLNSAWQGVNLEDIIISQLGPAAGAAGGRVMVRGPLVRVNAAAAQSLGMAFHELAANAARHGALLSPEGRVEASWTITGAAGEERLDIAWTEQGGPAVVLGGRRGLGTLILTRLAEQSLGARVTLDMAPGGIAWKLSAPLAKVIGTERAVPF